MEAYPHADLREKPIPSYRARIIAKRGYRDWPMARKHPAQQEPLEDAARAGLAGVNFYSRKDNPPYNRAIPGAETRLLLRTGVLERLRRVEGQLLSLGLRLYLFDAWRPAAVQSYMHDSWAPSYLKSQHPLASPEELQTLVDAYWAAGPARDDDIDPLSPPPHATGGALDLTLADASGLPLHMGTGFDELSPRAFTDALEAGQDAEACGNRRLLYWLMRAAGFQNNPTEWWHFSYGDQMWAKLESAELGRDVPAFYSNIVPGRVG